ncbi:MAG: hypothetical protein WED82_02665, partial [Balneolales bacterium]
STTIDWYEEDLNDYVIYSFGIYKDTLSVINPASGEIIHTINNFKSIQSVVTNKDGTRLYVATATAHSGSNPGFIYEVNTTTWDSRVIDKNASHLLTNQKGDLFFLRKLRTTPKRIFGSIDPDNGSVTHIDAINIADGSWFEDSLIGIDSDDPFLYALDENDKLYRRDYKNKETEYLFEDFDFESTTHFVLSNDGQKLYFPGGPILDLESEKIVGYLPMWQLSWIAVREDNKEVYITDPGSDRDETVPSGKVYIYDFQTKDISGHIDVKVKGIRNRTERIYLTAKERFAIVSDLDRRIFIIDLKKREVIKHYTFEDDSGSRTQNVQKMYLAPSPQK